MPHSSRVINKFSVGNSQNLNCDLKTDCVDLSLIAVSWPCVNNIIPGARGLSHALRHARSLESRVFFLIFFLSWLTPLVDQPPADHVRLGPSMVPIRVQQYSKVGFLMNGIKHIFDNRFLLISQSGNENSQIVICVTDNNECLVNNGECSRRCVNTIGGFNCTCPRGFRLQFKTLCTGTFYTRAFVSKNIVILYS